MLIYCEKNIVPLLKITAEVVLKKQDETLKRTSIIQRVYKFRQISNRYSWSGAIHTQLAPPPPPCQEVISGDYLLCVGPPFLFLLYFFLKEKDTFFLQNMLWHIVIKYWFSIFY
jgi:hypothetical protein